MYEAVTGRPMPRIKEASATSTRVTSRLPLAQSTTINEKALPRPVVETTMTTSPTATSRIAVGTMMRSASSVASMQRERFMRRGVNHDTTITARIASVAARTGDMPLRSVAIRTSKGMLKCQPVLRIRPTDCSSS